MAVSGRLAHVNLPQDRPLTATERAMLDRLLGADFSGVDELWQQVDALRVTGAEPVNLFGAVDLSYY